MGSPGQRLHAASQAAVVLQKIPNMLNSTVRAYEIHRTFSNNAPVINGLALIPPALFNYTDNNPWEAHGCATEIISTSGRTSGR
jgi:hypothetical protein